MRRGDWIFFGGKKRMTGKTAKQKSREFGGSRGSKKCSRGKDEKEEHDKKGQFIAFLFLVQLALC